MKFKLFTVSKPKSEYRSQDAQNPELYGNLNYADTHDVKVYAHFSRSKKLLVLVIS